MNPLSPLNRAQEVITLVCWIISHELKPLTPEEDPLQHALPIRPDIDRLDDALSPLFLIEPHLHQLNKHMAAINQSSGTPLIQEAAEAMDYGALQSLTRIHFPEFSTNPRLAKTNHILRELSYELNNLDRFLLKSPVGSLGRFTFGPLGIVEHRSRYQFFDSEPISHGSFARYTDLIRTHERSGKQIHTDPLYELAPVGWTDEWTQSLRAKESYIRNNEESYIVFLKNSAAWFPESIRTSGSPHKKLRGLCLEELQALIESFHSKNPDFFDSPEFQLRYAPALKDFYREGNFDFLPDDGIEEGIIQLLLAIGPESFPQAFTSSEPSFANETEF